MRRVTHQKSGDVIFHAFRVSCVLSSTVMSGRGEAVHPEIIWSQNNDSTERESLSMFVHVWKRRSSSPLWLSSE